MSNLYDLMWYLIPVVLVWAGAQIVISIIKWATFNSLSKAMPVSSGDTDALKERLYGHFRRRREKGLALATG